MTKVYIMEENTIYDILYFNEGNMVKRIIDWFKQKWQWIKNFAKTIVEKIFKPKVKIIEEKVEQSKTSYTFTPFSVDTELAKINYTNKFYNMINDFKSYCNASIDGVMKGGFLRDAIEGASPEYIKSVNDSLKNLYEDISSNDEAKDNIKKMVTTNLLGEKYHYNFKSESEVLDLCNYSIKSLTNAMNVLSNPDNILGNLDEYEKR